jgi:hypothetical protein
VFDRLAQQQGHERHGRQGQIAQGKEYFGGGGGAGQKAHDTKIREKSSIIGLFAVRRRQGHIK